MCSVTRRCCWENEIITAEAFYHYYRLVLSSSLEQLEQHKIGVSLFSWPHKWSISLLFIPLQCKIWDRDSFIKLGCIPLCRDGNNFQSTNVHLTQLFFCVNNYIRPKLGLFIGEKIPIVAHFYFFMTHY